MPIHSDHPDVGRLPRVLKDLALSGAPVAWAGRESPAVAAGLADVLARSLDLDFVLLHFRDPNGRVAAHFARANACLAFGDWLQDRLAEGRRPSRAELARSAGGEAQGEESQLSGRDARSGYGRSAQSSCLVSKTLTARERDVVEMISQGLCNKRIARALEISPETVKSHVKHIFLKLAVSTRAEAVSRTGLLGLLRGWQPTSRRSPVVALSPR
jgi:DNA-binding CsgD family transcriptional regulator